MVIKATRSKRTISPIVPSKTGILVESCYCRKCMETKSTKEFYQATDFDIDKNGYMSICRSCCKNIYLYNNRLYNSVEKVFYETCKKLNIRYDESAISATKLHLEKQGKSFDDESSFGTYKAKLVSVQKSFGEKADNLDLTFKESISIIQNQEVMKDDEFEEAKELKDFWGDYPTEDIAFLERELAEWKSNYSHSNRAELMVLKEICYIELEKKRLRKSGADSNTKDLIKQTNELLKVGGIQPYQTKAVEGSKSVDTLGMWIADVENFEPAQWLEDEGHEIYHDVANTEKYFQDYFVRPLRNFLLQTKDFNIEDDNFEELSDGFDSDDFDEKEEIEKG